MNKVLIIDDSKTIQAMMSSVLKGGGFEVKGAEKGSDGVVLANDWKPDLILLDVTLPDTNGFDLLSGLKSDESTKNIPVAMLTGDDKPEDKNKGLSMGAVGYLIKHSTPPKVLLEKVRSWIG